VRPSSTSSSESGGPSSLRRGEAGRLSSVLPWAALAAVLIVLAIDRRVMTAPGFGREVGALAQVVVLGSGRVERAFLSAELNTVLAGQAEVMLRAHGGRGFDDVAALGDRLGDEAVDVVILGLSEFETHRPLAGTAAGAAWAEKQPVLKLAGGRTESDLEALITRVGMTFPDLPEATRRDELIQLLSLSRGDHVSSREDQLRAAVEQLTEAGASVIVVELPLHPLSRQYDDATLREEALSFFAELAMDYDVTVVTEEMSGPFAKSDFASLTRVTDAGATKLSHSAARAVLEVLQARRAAAER